MATRKIRDEDGQQWVVLHVAMGWLLFMKPDNVADRRRLSPVPAGWECLTDAELAALCLQARPAPRFIVAPIQDAMVRRATRAHGLEVPHVTADDTTAALRSEVVIVSRELESAASELRAMNEELQAMIAESLGAGRTYVSGTA